jgi:hypothetical protein
MQRNSYGGGFAHVNFQNIDLFGHSATSYSVTAPSDSKTWPLKETVKDYPKRL